MKGRTRAATRVLLVLLTILVALSFASAQGGPFPPDIPKPDDCQDDDGEVCVVNRSIIYMCIEIASPAYCGAPVKVRLFPKDP